MAVSTDTTEQNRELARKAAAAMWAGRYDEFGEYLSDDYVGHDPMVPDGLRSAEDYRTNMAEMMDAMSDVEYRIHDIVAEGDHVFFRGELSCTHTGEYMGVPASNERIVVNDHIEMRFEDGRICESWAQYDAVGMMRQMGMEFPGGA